MKSKHVGAIDIIFGCDKGFDFVILSFKYLIVCANLLSLALLDHPSQLRSVVNASIHLIETFALILSLNQRYLFFQPRGASLQTIHLTFLFYSSSFKSKDSLVQWDSAERTFKVWIDDCFVYISQKFLGDIVTWLGLLFVVEKSKGVENRWGCVSLEAQ